MTGVSHYMPSLRRRNALANIFEGHEPGAQAKLQAQYLAALEVKATFNGGLQETLNYLPIRHIDREDIVHSNRYRERRNAIVSADMEVLEGPQWRRLMDNVINNLAEVQPTEVSSQPSTAQIQFVF